MRTINLARLASRPPPPKLADPLSLGPESAFLAGQRQQAAAINRRVIMAERLPRLAARALARETEAGSVSFGVPARG